MDYEGNPFPDDIDEDGDGMVYRIRNEETEELLLMDRADLEAWCMAMVEGTEKVQILWAEIP